MSQTAPVSTFYPSVEHKWALLRLSRRAGWVGLTERELTMILSLIDPGTESDWMVWCVAWPEWRPLLSCDLTIEVPVPMCPDDLPTMTDASDKGILV